MGATTILASQMHISIRRLHPTQILGLHITRSKYRRGLRGMPMRFLESAIVPTRACLEEMVSYRPESRVQVFRS
jgi:hypothetical protein